jgi:hypothetical protein
MYLERPLEECDLFTEAKTRKTSPPILYSKISKGKNKTVPVTALKVYMGMGRLCILKLGGRQI